MKRIPAIGADNQAVKLRGRGRAVAVASTRRTFAAFAVVTVVPAILIGLVLFGLTNRQLDHEGIDQGRNEALIVSETVVAPLLHGHPLTEGLRPDEERALARSVGAAVSDGQILRLRVRDTDGKIVWASDGSTDDDKDAGALEAAHGATVTQLTRLNADEEGDSDNADDSDADAGPRAVEAYTPIHALGSDRTIGVLEVYLPYAPIASALSTERDEILVGLVSGVGLLWLVLLGVSSWVGRRMRRSAAANEYLATHDTLTGMANRGEFSRVAVRALNAATSERRTAVAVVDLDRFKEVNDTLGHANGDLLLTKVADRLRSLLRETDSVARLGGDEFGLVLPGVRDPGEVVEILRRMRSELAAPLLLNGLPIAVEASIGFSLAPDDSTDMDMLLTQADVAMYVAKRKHLGVVHYQPEHDQYDARTLTLIAELGAAIERGELVLHYQPKASLPSVEICAVEALVRWQHPTRGLLYPDAFLFAAEQTELVEPLTRWVLREALNTLLDVEPEGRLSMAVNVSARSLTRTEFADDVLDIITDMRVDPSRLIVEVTETALVADPHRAAMTLARFHAAGITISVDDFGAGQTSLGYLATLPISELKIDKGFVLQMTNDQRNSAIVHSVIELGHSLGFTVTAEGVETQDVLDTLTAAHCDLVQGYLLARPMPVSALQEHLGAHGYRG